MPEDSRPFTGWVADDLGGAIVEFDGEEGSVWKLDRAASMWRRLAGPAATHYIHSGTVMSWTVERGWVAAEEL